MLRRRRLLSRHPPPCICSLAVAVAGCFLLATAVRVDEDETVTAQEQRHGHRSLHRRLQQRRSHRNNVFQNAFLEKVRHLKSRRQATAALASTALVQEKQEEAAFAGALDWAVRQGVRGAAQLRVQHFRKGPDAQPVRGLGARKDFSKGDVVLRVPAQLLMKSHGKATLMELRRLGVPSKLLEADCGGGVGTDECSRLRLVAGLLAVDRKPGASKWARYVSQLPQWSDFWQYHPMAADEKLLSSFYELPLVQMVWNSKVKQHQLYERYTKLGGNDPEMKFNWAHLVVLSSALKSPHGVGLVMAPVASLANTGVPQEQNVFLRMGGMKEGGGVGAALELRASREMNKGDELVVDYDHGRGESDDAFAKLYGIPLRGEAQPLEQQACQRLLRSVGVAVTSPTGLCTPPSHEAQKATFCALSRLSLEHCPSEML